MNLEKRLTAHYYNGSIKTHYQHYHDKPITKEILKQNTTILLKENNFRKLAIKEALFILNEQPSINIQFNSFTSLLKLYQHRNHHYRNGNTHENANVQNTQEEQNVQNVQDIQNMQDLQDIQEVQSVQYVQNVQHLDEP